MILCERACEASQADSPDYAAALLNEGTAKQRLVQFTGKPVEALREVEQLYEQAAKLLPKASAAWGFARRNQASVLRRMGDMQRAYAMAKEGLEIVETTRAQVERPHERIAFFETMAGQYATLVETCLNLADADDGGDAWTEEAWHWVHRSKSRTLLELLSHPDQANGSTPASDHSTVRPAVDVPPPNEVAGYLRQLYANSLTERRKPLLVEFFNLQGDEFAVFMLPLWEKTSPTVMRFQLNNGTIARLSVSLVETTGLLHQRGSTRKADEASVRLKAHHRLNRLFEDMGQLIEPWEDHLVLWEPTELVFAPHYLLNLLPLHAATWRGKPLIDHFPVSYIPSSALAQQFLQRRKTPNGPVLLFGNPSGELLGAESEVAQIAETLNPIVETHPFTGQHAIADQFFAHASSAAAVHLACHSRLDVDDFAQSGIQLADGTLTVVELMAKLRLDKTSLAYLSSCDSGRAVPGKTDELMALVRVFLSAGASTVIATLWTLDDTAACVFATNFYNLWLKKKLPMNLAFQKATQQTRQRYPQSFAWAPFVLFG